MFISWIAGKVATELQRRAEMAKPMAIGFSHEPDQVNRKTKRAHSIRIEPVENGYVTSVDGTSFISTDLETAFNHGRAAVTDRMLSNDVAMHQASAKASS